MLRSLTNKLSLFWTLQMCGWAAFACAMFLATAVVLPVRVAALEKVIFTLMGMSCSLLLRAIYRRFYSKHLDVFWIVALSAICSYIAALLWTLSYSFTVELIRDWTQNRSLVIDHWQRLFNGGLYHSFILLAWSVLYFGIKHYLELQEQTRRTLKAEALAQQAQLQALRYQLNPHFLFNTLNAISTLVAQHENAAANRMLVRLSDFLRITLKSSGAPEVSLADELDFARRYLDIEKVRLGDRLSVSFDIAPETLVAAVPNFLLQPLVENAFRHSIAPREAGGSLEIEARRTGNWLRLEVRDDGTQGPITISGNGTGLSNTRARLTQLYGASHRFELKEAAGGGLAVIIELPFRIHAEHARRTTYAYENSHVNR